VTPALERIRARLDAGEALAEADLRLLAETTDLVALGTLADDLRHRRHGARTTFVRVFEVAVDAPVPAAPDAVPPAAREIRLVGRPGSVDGTVSVVRQVARVGGGRPLAGFALDDLVRLARAARISLEALARHLREAGLESVAEAPVDRLDDAAAAVAAVVRGGLAAPKATVARAASSPEARLEAIRRVAALQRATGALRVFAPLPREVDPSEPTTGYDDVKHVALARIALAEVPSIQVDWTAYGPKLAQVALTFGADDLDRVPPVDRPDLGPRRSVREEVVRNIRAAWLEPVERDGRFAEVRE
jgi:aminodeoxyfutalosine synthase